MKKTKKYKLHNSYFKVNNMFGLPDTIREIAKYEKEHGELPFDYAGDNWVYDAFCERQKYRGVRNSQFLTPDATVNRMMHFAGKYFTGNDVLEPCCGTGQITKELLKDGYKVTAFDNDLELVGLCKLLLPDATVFQSDFREVRFLAHQIIANPPYETPVLTEFLEWNAEIQDEGEISILLLPKSFINKDKPKRTFEAIRKFFILEVEDMREEFVRTKIQAEIVVLKKW